MEENKSFAPSDFFSRQIASWPMAASNFDALKNVKVKEVGQIGLLDFKVQFNPARKVSSAAKVDATSLKARKCFLCAENRPPEQFSEEILPGYELLVNPFPIFPEHYTIPILSHNDQSIRGRIKDMCEIARKLPGKTVFYNGPKCGASAPDHMHFQAGSTDFMTLPELLDRISETGERGEPARLWVVEGVPMGIAVIEGYDSSEIEDLFSELYNHLPKTDDETEPMMNVLCYTPQNAPEDYVRLVVLPRKKHRPDFYGTEGEGKMLISPASVDLGGVFITPREEDFEIMDKEIIKKVLVEVCMSPKELEDIVENL